MAGGSQTETERLTDTDTQMEHPNRSTVTVWAYNLRENCKHYLKMHFLCTDFSERRRWGRGIQGHLRLQKSIPQMAQRLYQEPGLGSCMDEATDNLDLVQVCF